MNDFRYECIEDVLLDREIQLTTEESFNMIIETLTRIGMSSEEKKTIFQSCHILSKRGKYYIVHFKEMMALDGKDVDFSHKDLAIRNMVTLFLERWGLCRSLNPIKDKEPVAKKNYVKIIPFKEKDEWNFVSKYTFNNQTKKD